MGRVIRFGICGCTSFFHGQFDGRRVEFAGAPEPLEIREVIIPEGKQCEALRRSRALFFLDVHHAWPRESLRWNVSITLCELVPNGGRTEKLYRVCAPGKALPHRIVGWSECDTIPSAGRILIAMKKLADTLRPERQRLWIERMTPVGWRLPETAPT